MKIVFLLFSHMLKSSGITIIYFLCHLTSMQKGVLLGFFVFVSANQHTFRDRR